MDTSALRQFILESFNLDEVRDLCFVMRITFDDLGGENRAAKVRELIAWCERRDRLADLEATAQRLKNEYAHGQRPRPTSTASNTLRATPPAPPAHFTGREADLDKFTRLLTQGKSVAITALHGMGGIGKTSLAQKLAEEIAPQFPGGVLWWTLGPNPDVITALDVWARHADPNGNLSDYPSAEARAEIVRPLLARLGKLCVIIDDVWEAASFNVLRSAIPPGCPLLMTTRDADLAKSLRCRVERIDALSDDEAVELLVNLLGSLEDNADAACDIAHLTEGLPLALELIAGLADSPADLPALAQRLKDKSPLDVLRRGATREQSIETCFTLSYEHLDPDLQRRFCALGVFALAPFDRAAIAAVWAEDGDAVEQSIRQLVRHSLLARVTPNEVRNLNATDESAIEYTQHALLHGYALKLLTQLPSPGDGSIIAGRGAGGEGLFARHADYYRSFAKTQPWREVEHAFDQVEHGWQWVQQHAPEQIVDYVSAVQNFLRVRGRPFELINWLNDALTQTRAANDHKNEGATLNNLGLVYDDLGQKDKALDYYAQALDILRDAEHGDRAGEGVTLNNLGGVYRALGQPDKALDYYAQALDILRAVGDRAGEGATLNNLGLVYDNLGQKDKALDYYAQALVIRREVGDRFGESVALFNMGLVLDALGRPAEAVTYLEQCVALDEAIGHPELESDRRALARVRARLTPPAPSPEMMRLFRERGSGSPSSDSTLSESGEGVGG